jgi:hypothetical protein
MIVCSCTVVSDHDIELALLDLLSQPEAPIPTPGLVFRHLSQKMTCCGCAPLAVETIYAKVEELERRGLISPYRSLSARESLMRLQLRGKRAADPPPKDAKKKRAFNV